MCQNKKIAWLVAGVVLVLVIIVGWVIGRYYQSGNSIGN